MGAHGTRGGTAKRARNATEHGWSRLGRSLALPAGRQSRAGFGHGPCSGKQHILGHGRNTDGTRPDEEADRSAGRRPVRARRPRSPFSSGGGPPARSRRRYHGRASASVFIPCSIRGCESFRLQALRAATGGGSEPPKCRLQIANRRARTGLDDAELTRRWRRL